MDIVMTARHWAVSDAYRALLREKLAKVARLDARVERVDVALSHEENPRLAERAYRVELTCAGPGPVVRAEAAAADEHTALDAALGRLEGRLRREADRRADHRKHRSRPSGAPAPEALRAGEAAVAGDPAVDEAEEPPALVVREKLHRAPAMDLDQALYEMELVGHDFFLFLDARTSRPSVVYRRRGYDYGVITLEVASA